VSDERRQFQRLTLAEPVDAWFGDWSVRLLNLSATGAGVETDELLPEDAQALLRFFWRGQELELRARTARKVETRTGLEFLEESETLCELLAASATELLRAQEANAAGQREANVFGDETLTAASARARLTGYVTWTLNEGGWKATHSLLPDQPPNGFTVSAGEDGEQVAMLCRTYEAGDAEARRLTRMLAELSVAGSA
jgi:hypothetical protein